MQDCNKIQLSQYFEQPIEAVWAALVLESEVTRWLLPGTFKAREGFRFTLGNGKNRIRGIVLKAKPVYDLVYSWIEAGSDIDTTVSWHLQEMDGGTVVILTHSGIEKYSGENAVVMFNNFKGGWESRMRNLVSHLTG